MIKRIVRLSFKADFVPEFISIFEHSKYKIRSFEGCQYLELLKEKENVFFTYSIWDNDEALQAYRQSDLFKKTWAKTKVLFDEKPMAWSLESIVKLTDERN